MNEGWVRVVQGAAVARNPTRTHAWSHGACSGTPQYGESDRVETACQDFGGHVDGTLGLSGGLYHDAIMRRAGLSARYSRMWPLPVTTNFVEVISGSPIGPRACSFCVEIPISAPKPNCSPSVQRVEALTMMPALSTVATNR